MDKSVDPSHKPTEDDILRAHLVMTDRQIADGIRQIERQRAILAQFERGGQDTRAPRALLETLLQSQALHEEHRRRILQQLRM